MQTDAWLTDASQSDCCPLCSQPLAGGSNTCSACGFTAHEPAPGLASSARPSSSGRSNPATPIPARASARRVQSSPGGSSRRLALSQSAGSFSTASAERARGWPHDSPDYAAYSSLSALSLIIAETPTAPPRQAGRLEHIDEIDTVPPALSGTQVIRTNLPETPPSPDTSSLCSSTIAIQPRAPTLPETGSPTLLARIDEIDTFPEPASAPSRASQPAPPETPRVSVDATSWTASSGSPGSLITRVSRRQHSRSFTLLDSARWWLLRPGHMEFLLWLIGSVLLFGLTFLLLLATILDMAPPGLPGRGNLPTSTTSTFPGTSTPMLSTGLHLVMLGKTALTPGAELRLQGRGFYARSQVIFLLDGHWSLLDQYGKDASIQADPSGSFTVNLWLGRGSIWSAGPHQILAREMGSGHQVTIPITITTPTVSYPGSRSTPAPPVYPTSLPVHPRPTPPPRPITPTPTVSSTPGTTPTASPVGSATPAGTATFTRGKGAASSPLGNALNNDPGSSPFARLTALNPLVWVIGFCYLFSLLCMGIAGLIRRRR